MAPQRRTSGDSLILIGRQSKRGTHITGITELQGLVPDWSDSDSIVAHLIKRRFPFVRNTLDPTAETTESESIVGQNAAVGDIITKRSAAGEWEFEVLPEDVAHLLVGWFNPNTGLTNGLPTNTDVTQKAVTDAITAAGVIDDGKITVGAVVGTGANRTQTITIDHTDTTELPNASWPGKLRIKLASTTTLAGSGKVQIFGEQRRSRSNNYNASGIETINTTAAALEGTNGIDTTKFYRKVNKIVLSGFSTFAATTENPVLTLRADTKRNNLTLNTLNALFPGWTTQMDKASTPYIGYDVVVDGFRLTVTGGTMRLILAVIASYVQEGRTLILPTEIAYKLPAYDRHKTGGSQTNLADYEGAVSGQEARKKVLSNYPYKNLNLYPANGTAVALGDVGETLDSLATKVENGTATIVPLTSIEIAGTHNYGEPEGYTGDPVGGEPTTREGETRSVTVNATIVHETDQDYDSDNKTVFWQDRYFEGQKIPIIVRNYNWAPDGRQTLIETRMPNCKLTQVPAHPIEGQGQNNRTLAFEAERTATATTPNEIEMHIYSQGGLSEN